MPVRARQSLYRPQRRWRRRIGLTLLILFGFAVSGGIGTGVYFLPAIGTAFSDLGQKANAAPVGAQASSPSPGATAAPVDNGPAPASGQPFTLLLLGSDNDSKFSGDHSLTQSMILCRVDPAAKKVTMLSIPRDLYVPLSTGGTDKIDKAYSYGGAQASIATVQRNFGVHVDYYAWIGLEGLVKLIDDVGGIDVVASNPVLDDYYPADLTSTNPFNFHRVFTWPGPQHMTGLQAMEYVRSRHGDLRGDFGRSARQQQVLLALRAKAKLLSPADLPDLAGAIASNFKSSVSLSQVSDLLPIAGSLPLANVTQVVLSSPYTTGAVIGTQDVLIPNWNLINAEVAKYFPTT
jgi:LCP family protein required for cell wall assembly